MRRPFGILLSLSVLFLAAESPAADLGNRWRALSADETAIIFSDPGLTGTTARYLSQQAEDYSYKLQVGMWSSAALPFPKAQVFVQWLEPGFKFNQTFELRPFVERLKFFKGQKISFRSEQSARNGIGPARFMNFSAGSFSCIVFGQDFGEAVMDDSPSFEAGNTDRLLGYYCEAEDTALDRTAADRILGNLSLRQKGATN